MGVTVEQSQIEQCLDAVFEAAVAPGKWPAALSELATLFHSGFADVCSWTPDRAQVVGVAHGLDQQDYEGQMLGFWFNRNVWAKKSPVRLAGEVISTRQMMAREDLSRSEMYHEYLQRRGLHEGMRLSLWVDPDSLSDISLLRPWSQGAFGPAEIELGQTLLPHLQRAASLTRRLSRSRLHLDVGTWGGEDDVVAMIAFDHHGVPVFFNRAAERVFQQRGACLRMEAQGLSAGTPEATHQLRGAVASATGRHGALRKASTLRLPWHDGSAAVTVVVQPLSRQGAWPEPRRPAAVALFRDPKLSALSISALRRIFDLTESEAQVALDLLAGSTLQRSAARTGRSRNTVRTHLSRVMEKTGTTRQVDLVRLLMDVDMLGLSSRPFV